MSDGNTPENTAHSTAPCTALNSLADVGTEGAPSVASVLSPLEGGVIKLWAPPGPCLTSKLGKEKVGGGVCRFTEDTLAGRWRPRHVRGAWLVRYSPL